MMAANQQNPQQDIIQTLGVAKGRGRAIRILRWTLVAALIVLVAAGIRYGLSKTDGKTPQFKTQEAIRSDLTVTVTATGNLAPTSEVVVGSELSGIVKQVAVDFNDRVKTGQHLAYLDDTRYRAAVMGAKAALASAQARLAQAQATVTQKQQSLKRLRQADSYSAGKALSPYDLETAQADLERAKADEAVARASIQLAESDLLVAETNLAKTVIVSPVNGIVLSRKVDPGQTVAASLQAPELFTLAEDLARMELQVDVDEADVGHVHKDQQATFTVDAYPGRVFQARITQVRYGAQTTNNVVTYKTLLKVDNPDLVLRPGMTATADIIVQKIEDALLVPNAALRYMPPIADSGSGNPGLVGMLMPRPPRARQRPADGSAGAPGRKAGSRVWVLNQGRPQPVPVVTGPSDGTRTVVTSGNLQPGAPLIVDTIAVKP